MLPYRPTIVATATFVLLVVVALGCGEDYQPKEVTPAEVAELVKGDNTSCLRAVPAVVGRE